MKTYNITVVDQYGTEHKDSIIALGYEILDQFIHFWSGPDGYCASYRADTVLKVKQVDVLISTDNLTGDGLPKSAKHVLDGTQAPYVGHSSPSLTEMWYVDNNKNLVKPVVEGDLSDAFNFATTVVEKPEYNIPITASGSKPATGTICNHDPELLRKLSAMSEQWDTYPTSFS